MSPWISARFLQAQSDERLLAAARQGHERAFEMLVSRYRGPLLGYARRLLPDGSAEDALQQGLLRGWSALQRGSEVQNARAWLFQVVHNTAVDMLRSVRPQQHRGLEESLPGAAGVEAAVELRLAARETLAAVAALPEIQREALLRTAVGGDSHERVALTLGVSAASVRGLVYRARATLRAAASALTPPQLVAWAATAERGGTPLLQRLAGTGASGGGEALFKYGAAALAAGAAAAGTVVLHHDLAKRLPASRAPAPRVIQGGGSLRRSSPAAAAIDLADARVHVTRTTAPASRARGAHGLIGLSREAPSQPSSDQSGSERGPRDGSGSDGSDGSGGSDSAGLGAEGKNDEQTASQAGVSGGDGPSGGSTSSGGGSSDGGGSSGGSTSDVSGGDGTGGEQQSGAATSDGGSPSPTSSSGDGSGGGSGSDGSGSGLDGGVSGSGGSDVSQPNGGPEPTELTPGG